MDGLALLLIGSLGGMILCLAFVSRRPQVNNISLCEVSERRGSAGCVIALVIIVCFLLFLVLLGGQTSG